MTGKIYSLGVLSAPGMVLGARGMDISRLGAAISRTFRSQAAQSLAETFGRLDILINNAGISGENTNTPSDTTLSVMRTVYNINVFGMVGVTKAMLPLLRKSQAGRIVNVSSVLGSMTQVSDRNYEFFQVNNVPYQSSKAAVNAMTVAFAKELAGTPITDF